MSQPSTDPAPSTSTAIAATDPSATTGQLAFLLLGMLLFVALCALPIAALLWFGGVFAGSFGVAELLERTRGLAPDTYKHAFRIALIFTGAMALTEIGRIFARPPADRGLLARLVTRPSIGLLLLFIPTIFLARIDMRGTDVPDLLTTSLLLCCLGYIYVILPLSLLTLAGGLTRGLWRRGRRSGFAAGALGTLGLAFASCVPVLCATGNGDSDDPTVKKLESAWQRGLAEAGRRDFVPGSLAFLGALAEAIPNPPAIAPPSPTPAPPPWVGDGDKDRFDECIESLSRNRQGGIAREDTVNYFTLRGTERGLAEQIVQESLIELCLGHAKQPYDDLLKRFRWLTQKRRQNEWRRQNNWNQCELSVAQHYYADPAELPEDQVDFIAVNRALCSLEDPRDRVILELSVLDLDADEIGRNLDPPLSGAAVRQRKKRALAAVRKHLQLH